MVLPCIETFPSVDKSPSQYRSIETRSGLEKQALVQGMSLLIEFPIIDKYSGERKAGGDRHRFYKLQESHISCT